MKIGARACKKPAWCSRRNGSGPQLLLCWWRRWQRLQLAAGVAVAGAVAAGAMAAGAAAASVAAAGAAAAGAVAAGAAAAGAAMADAAAAALGGPARRLGGPIRQLGGRPLVGRLGMAAAWYLNKRLKQYQ